MTVQVNGRCMWSNVTAVSATFVGKRRWVVEQLRGRTLTTDQALAVLQLAEVLPQPRPDNDDDPLWADVIGWLHELGLGHTPQTMAIVLGIPCKLTPLPADRYQHPSARRGWSRWLAR
ncbi:hypothetical protein [Nocardia nova]|uniref:hypothetical protein n=1 Tax=Nocardia nova TaxID=37330 RepID=UPI0033CF6CA4